MSYYDEVYLRRLNRYGLDYQSRLQGQRERNFENYLLKTPFRVDFQYNHKNNPGSLERYKQDYTETQMYLLTRRELEIPNGEILKIIGQNDCCHPWMVWWKEDIASSGYNRYVLLKMTHIMDWVYEDSVHKQLGFFHGPGTKLIQDSIKSSTGETLYTENDNLHMFITPYHKSLVKELYFEVTEGNTTQAYWVTDVDINSTPGVAYVSVDPTLKRSQEDPDIIQPDNTTTTVEDYWLEGGQ